MAPARVLFIATQSITMLLGLVGLATAFLSLFTSLSDFANFVPVEMIQATGVVSAFVLIVSLIGLSMVICKLDECFVIFVLVSLLQIIFNIGFFVVLVLFANEQQTIEVFDDLLNDTFINFEQEAVDSALDEDVNFEIVQNQLNCCGISFQTAFELAQVRDGTMTGERCQVQDNLGNFQGTALQVMNQIVLQANRSFQVALDLQQQTSELSKADFFCLTDLEGLTNDILQTLTLIFAFVIAFEMISVLCACLIFCCVPRDEDGKYDFEEENRIDRVLVHVTANARAPISSLGNTLNRKRGLSTQTPKLNNPNSFGKNNSFNNSFGKNNSLNNSFGANGSFSIGSTDRRPVVFDRTTAAVSQSFRGVLGLIAPFSKKGVDEINTLPPPTPPPKVERKPKGKADLEDIRF